MKKLSFLLFLPAVLSINHLFSQCTVRASIPRDTVVCGDEVVIDVFGKGQGQVIFQENFNSGAPTGWAFTQQATFTNPCSPSGVDGTTHIWMGDRSGVPRSLETNAYNFSAATAGATICFDMLFAKQGNTSPCEGPDEPQEGVYLQYKIGNGSWVTINYFDPNGGNDPLLTNWNNWCFQLPQAALTSNVSIRWFQDNDSGAEYDHWGLDNIQIYFNDPSFTISVAAPAGNNIYSFPQGSSGGAYTPSHPRQTTTYYVTMQNTNNVVCRDTVSVFVRQPDVVVNAGRDTTLCTGKCAVLNATAKVVRYPAKVATYSNIQPDTADITSFGGIIAEGAEVNINVQTLNMQQILSNSIVSVCIDEVKMQGFGFGGFGVGGKDLEIYLLCPDSTKIKLMPTNSSTVTPGLFGYQTIFKNMCFVPVGPTVASASDPKTGNFGSTEPFNNMVGCTANGVWKLQVRPGSGVGGGSVITTGWSITFDDPESSYQGNFTWNPTTDMTGASTLSPTVCPTANRTYILSASDTASCLTLVDTVNVSVHNCCNFSIAATATQPNCGSADGSINLTASPSGNYSFAWSDGNTSASRTNLAAGTYTITVTDVTNNCTTDTTIILDNKNAPVLTFTNQVNPSCGQNNGSVEITFSGGTAPYQLTITEGQNAPTTQTFTAAGTQTISNLGAGNYVFTIKGSDSCSISETITFVSANTPVLSFDTIQPDCGAANGSIQVSVSGGVPNYSYVWSNAAKTSVIGSIPAGNYSVTVTDTTGCSVVGNITLNNKGSFNISLGSDTGFCAGGETVLNAPSGYVNYFWSTGDTSQSIKITTQGNYHLTVTDAQGCSAADSVIVNVYSLPVIVLAKDTTVFENNTIKLAPTINGSMNASGTYTWTPDKTITCTNCSQPEVNPSDTTVYTLKFTDANNCTDSTTVSVNIVKGGEVKMPNVFSPNGDGINDLLKPVGFNVKQIKWKVYNRWGELVFAADDFNDAWDGSFKSGSQPAGIYLYSLDVTFQNKEEKHLQGAITLLR
ncbi:MAG TPA: gliding motility-associated C-terminal domain-containing protein [Chitinophagales bacterium]|nr:gliding motility-associated C-terminal domain-containing protein [Chitinophagales bacterium]